MNNPNPFLSPGSFLEQKNKARMRLKIAVFFSISLSVVVLMALLIQGCRKPHDADTGSTDTNTPQLATSPTPETNPTPTPPAPETNPAPIPPPPVVQTPPPTPPPVVAPPSEDYTVIKGDTYA